MARDGFGVRGDSKMATFTVTTALDVIADDGQLSLREALALASKVAAEGICGMELVEVSPPYDTSDITALMGTRVIVDVLGSLVASGNLGKHKAHIDKPVAIPHGEFEGKRWSNDGPHKF